MQKILEKMVGYQPFKETVFIPSREPPGKLNNLSKIVNY
jgi:hypothetical protein